VREFVANALAAARIRVGLRGQARDQLEHAVEVKPAQACASASTARPGISSASSISAQAFATAAAWRSASPASFGRQRLHGRKPAHSASSQVRWNATFSRRASRAALQVWTGPPSPVWQSRAGANARTPLVAVKSQIGGLWQCNDANQISYDTVQYYNSALALLAACGVTALTLRLLPPPSLAMRARRMLALTLRDLRRLAVDGQLLLSEDWDGRMIGRLTGGPLGAPRPRRRRRLSWWRHLRVVERSRT
jgi:hypothetical protein